MRNHSGPALLYTYLCFGVPFHHFPSHSTANRACAPPRHFQQVHKSTSQRRGVPGCQIDLRACHWRAAESKPVLSMARITASFGRSLHVTQIHIPSFPFVSPSLLLHQTSINMQPCRLTRETPSVPNSINAVKLLAKQAFAFVSRVEFTRSGAHLPGRGEMRCEIVLRRHNSKCLGGWYITRTSFGKIKNGRVDRIEVLVVWASLLLIIGLVVSVIGLSWSYFKVEIRLEEVFAQFESQLLKFSSSGKHQEATKSSINIPQQPSTTRPSSYFRFHFYFSNILIQPFSIPSPKTYLRSLEKRVPPRLQVATENKTISAFPHKLITGATALYCKCKCLYIPRILKLKV